MTRTAEYLAKELRKADERLARRQITALEHATDVDALHTEALARGVYHDMRRLYAALQALEILPETPSVPQ